MDESISNQPGGTSPQLARILGRARVIFFILALLVFSSSVANTYIGFKTGAIESRIIKPAKENLAKFAAFVSEQQQATQYEPDTSSVHINNQTSTSSTVNITVTSTGSATVRTNTNSNQPKVIWVYPTIATTNYTQTQQSVDDWWAKVQQENANASAQSQKDLETFKQQSQQKLEEFKQQGQTGMQQFEQDMQKQQQEFLQSHGITP
jgi:hypothetical protein